MKNKPTINLNEPSFYILLALSKEPMSGYELTRTIYNLTKGRLEVKTGTMYPTLKRLSEHQLIELIEDKSQERNKKIYQLTDEGKQLLQMEVDLLNEKIEEVKSIMSKTKGGVDYEKDNYEK